MTKIYIANNTHEVYLSSGKTMVLTEEEMGEIAEDSPLVSNLEEEIARLKRELSRIQDITSGGLTELGKLEEVLIVEDFDIFQAVKPYLSDLRKKLELL